MSRHDLIVVKRLELLNMKLCPHENMKLNASLGGLFEAVASYPHTAKCDERCLKPWAGKLSFAADAQWFPPAR